MKKRIFSTLLVLCMVLALLPVTAMATPTLATTVTVGGRTLNTGNPYATTNASGTVATTGATAANYNVKFDAATGTLTLRNANINTASSSAIYTTDELTIVAEGTNMVTTSDAISCAIQVAGGGGLTLKGSGALTAVSDKNTAVFVARAITVRTSARRRSPGIRPPSPSTNQSWPRASAMRQRVPPLSCR